MHYIQIYTDSGHCIQTLYSHPAVAQVTLLVTQSRHTTLKGNVQWPQRRNKSPSGRFGRRMYVSVSISIGEPVSRGHRPMQMSLIYSYPRGALLRSSSLPPLPVLAEAFAL